MDTFDVLIVYGVFGVLFGFRRCDFRSSDLFPKIPGPFKSILFSSQFLSQI
jgi:hypothetical protein